VDSGECGFQAAGSDGIGDTGVLGQDGSASSRVHDNGFRGTTKAPRFG
jgi:hypothetical protein